MHTKSSEKHAIKEAASSIHNINADTGLIFCLKPFYILLNMMNNSFPGIFPDKRIVSKDFLTGKANILWSEMDHLSSPARILSDMFWHSLPWKQMEEQLGEIRMLDCGCGSGIYYHKLQRFSKNKIHTYTGIDIYEHNKWEETNIKNVNFHIYDGINTADFLNERINFIISQSAVEHFRYDLSYFDQISRFVDKTRRPIIQIHLMPAPYCLKLYGCHGIRQYTLRTISKITRLFGSNSNFYLFNLGSKISADFHYKNITARKDCRIEHEAQYKTQLYDTIIKDTGARKGMPLFYCLIICTNLSARLF